MYGTVVLLAMALSAETVAAEQAAVASTAAAVEPLAAEPVPPIVVNPNRPTFAAPRAYHAAWRR